MDCKAGHTFQDLANMVKAGKNPPLCTVCGGVLRPDIVLFEDAMSSDFYSATEALKASQLLLVVGSSLQVYPAAGLPGLSRRLVIINREPTQWDEHADVVINRSAGEVFRDLLAEMGYAL
jgi:NAD-dependent deacetylase